GRIDLGKPAGGIPKGFSRAFAQIYRSDLPHGFPGLGQGLGRVPSFFYRRAAKGFRRDRGKRLWSYRQHGGIRRSGPRERAQRGQSHGFPQYGRQRRRQPDRYLDAVERPQYHSNQRPYLAHRRSWVRLGRAQRRTFPGLLGWSRGKDPGFLEAFGPFRRERTQGRRALLPGFGPDRGGFSLPGDRLRGRSIEKGPSPSRGF